MSRFLQSAATLMVLISSLSIGQMRQEMAQSPTPDSQQAQNMSSLDRKSAMLDLREKQLAISERELDLQTRQALLDRRFREMMEKPAEMDSRQWPVHYGTNYPYRPFFPVALLIICILIMIAVNVLLTTIVWYDMMRYKQFKAIWIPVLLLAGVPGTIIYALFRIGDNLRQGGAL